MPDLNSSTCFTRSGAISPLYGLLFSLVLTAGCLDPNGPADASGQPGSELSYNPQRAFLQLSELDQSEVVIPEPVDAAESLSARGQRRLKKAARLGAERRFTEAGLELERALQTDPNCFDIHLELARILHQSGNLERSRTHLQRVLELRPDLLELHYLLAIALSRDGEKKQAIVELRIALLCMSSSKTGTHEGVAGLRDEAGIRMLVFFRLAELLRGEGYLTAALEMFARYGSEVAALPTGGSPNAEATTLLRVAGPHAADPVSQIQAQLGKYGQAADTLKQSFTHTEPTVEDRARLVDLLSLAHRIDEAIACARELANIDARGLELLVDVHLVNNQPDSAASDLATILAQHREEADYILAYSAALARLDREQEANEVLKSFLDGDPSQHGVRWNLVGQAVGRSDWPYFIRLTADAVRLGGGASADARSRVLSLTHSQRSDLLLAAQEWKQLDAPSAYLLGCAAIENKQFDLAVSHLGHAVRTNPDLVPARVELAAAFIADFRWDEALKAVADLTNDQQENARIQWLRGSAFDGLDQTEEAIQAYQAAARLNSEDTRAAKALARLYRRNGETLRAIRQYRAVLEIDQTDGESRESLFKLHFAKGEREEALAQLEELRKDPGAVNRVARCTARMDLKSPRPDLAQFRKTVQAAMSPGQPDAQSLLLIARSYLNDTRYEEGLRAAQRAAEVAPDDAEVQEVEAHLCGMTLQFEKSAEIMRRLTHRYPNRDKMIREHIRFLTIDQQFDQAAAVAEGILSRDPLSDERRIRYRETLVEILKAARRHDELIATVSKWREAAPDDIEFRRMLVDAYLVADRSVDALQVIQDWYEEDPSNLALQPLLVTLLVRADKADQAFQIVLAAISEDPSSDRLQILLIDALSSAKRYDEAIELVSNCIISTSNLFDYQQKLLQTYDAANRTDDAIALLGEMIHQSEQAIPNTTSAMGNRLRRILADRLLRSERYVEAQVKLSRWIDNASDPQWRFEYLKLLSLCHQARGQRKLAIESLEQAYEMNPTEPGLNNDLAYSWADEGMHLEKAEKCLRYAVAHDPQNATFLDSLGWVYYKRGRFEEAVKWLSRSKIAGADKDPVINDHLGDALWRLGQQIDAIKSWRLAELHALDRLNEDSPLNERQDQEVLDAVQAKIKAAEGDHQPELAPVGENPAGDSDPPDGSIATREQSTT